MKAKDPAIKIGAVLTSPGDWPDGQSPDWNTAVLAACGTKIDFVIVHWYAQGPGFESDAGQYCGANAAGVKIFVTETNSVYTNPGKQSVSLVNGLFAADDYMDCLENGVANVGWWDLHNGGSTSNNNSGSLYGMADYGDYGLLSNATADEPAANTPFASYYGIQMLTHLGRPGDQMVTASSSQGLLAAHAVKQAAASTVYFYGETSSAITSVSGRAGVKFTWTVPPYSLITIVLAPISKPPTAPVWSAAATASPAILAPGASSQISATVTDSGVAYGNSIVDLEIYNSSGVKVGQRYYTGQNFSAYASRTHSFN